MTLFGQVTEENFETALQRQRERPFLHGAESVAADEGRRFHYSERLHRKLQGHAGDERYSATKAVMRSFARTWTVDLKERKIRVNAVSPGPIATHFRQTLPQNNRSSLALKLWNKCRWDA